jgi:hypothetical protein
MAAIDRINRLNQDLGPDRNLTSCDLDIMGNKALQGRRGDQRPLFKEA